MPKTPSSDYRIEFALMKADIVSLKSGQASIEAKLDKFIEKADDTYLTKKEADLRFASLNSDVAEARTLTATILEWAWKLGPYLLVGFLYLSKLI